LDERRSLHFATTQHGGKTESAESGRWAGGTKGFNFNGRRKGTLELKAVFGEKAGHCRRDV